MPVNLIFGIFFIH